MRKFPWLTYVRKQLQLHSQAFFIKIIIKTCVILRNITYRSKPNTCDVAWQVVVKYSFLFLVVRKVGRSTKKSESYRVMTHRVYGRQQRPLKADQTVWLSRLWSCSSSVLFVVPPSELYKRHRKYLLASQRIEGSAIMRHTFRPTSSVIHCIRDRSKFHRQTCVIRD